jgi:hypothetical protein
MIDDRTFPMHLSAEALAKADLPRRSAAKAGHASHVTFNHG